MAQVFDKQSPLEFIGRQLGQLHPTNTTATSIYSPGTNVSAVITDIIVTSTVGTGETFSIFLDENGSTADATTAKVFAAIITANSAVILTELRWYMNNPAGNLIIESTSNGNTSTFTVYGEEVHGG